MMSCRAERIQHAKQLPGGWWVPPGPVLGKAPVVVRPHQPSVSCRPLAFEYLDKPYICRVCCTTCANSDTESSNIEILILKYTRGRRSSSNSLRVLLFRSERLAGFPQLVPTHGPTKVTATRTYLFLLRCSSRRPFHWVTSQSGVTGLLSLRGT